LEQRSGARLASVAAPRSVAGAGGRAFDAALTRLQALPETSPPNLDVAKLPGGRVVTSHGLVITHDGLLASESAWDGNLEATGVLGRKRLPRAQAARGVHATLISQWCGAYYHWLTDALPRFAALEAAHGVASNVIVPEDLKPWQRRSLDLLALAIGSRRFRAICARTFSCGRARSRCSRGTPRAGPVSGCASASHPARRAGANAYT